MVILLIAHPRTGTTFLRSLLNSNSNVYFYGEVFHPDSFFWGFYTYMRVIHPTIVDHRCFSDYIDEYFDKLIGLMVDAGKVNVGFDVKIPHMRHIYDFAKNLSSEKYAILHLVRENYFESIVSYELMNRDGVSHHVVNDGLSNEYELDPIYIEPLQLKTQASILQAEDLLVETAFQKHLYKKIKYEDLCFNLEKTLSEISNFMGVSEAKYYSSNILKSNNLSLKDKLLNYHEVCRYFMATDYIKFL